jgi:hypothetical protein
VFPANPTMYHTSAPATVHPIRVSLQIQHGFMQAHPFGIRYNSRVPPNPTLRHHASAPVPARVTIRVPPAHLLLHDASAPTRETIPVSLQMKISFRPAHRLLYERYTFPSNSNTSPCWRPSSCARNSSHFPPIPTPFHQSSW